MTILINNLQEMTRLNNFDFSSLNPHTTLNNAGSCVFSFKRGKFVQSGSQVNILNRKWIMGWKQKCRSGQIHQPNLSAVKINAELSYERTPIPHGLLSYMISHLHLSLFPWWRTNSLNRQMNFTYRIIAWKILLNDGLKSLNLKLRLAMKEMRLFDTRD